MSKEIYEQLNELYLSNSFDNLNKMIKLMNSKEIRKDIDKIIKKNDGNKDKMLTLINVASTIFESSGDNTGMSDTEYDIIHDILTNKYNYKLGISSPIIKATSKIVFHKYPSLRGTLDKIYYLDEDESSINPSRDGLPDWIKRCERKIYEKTQKWVNLEEYDIYVFPKFDGVSGIIEFKKGNNEIDRALTRGFTETNEAQDITHILKPIIKSSDLSCDYGLKTEIMMSEEDFNLYNEKYGTKYKNSRSIVSSIINSDEIDERINYLQLVPLRISKMIDGKESEQTLSPNVFNYPYIQCKLKETDKIREFASHNKYANGLRCDGAVIYIIDKDIQNILGRENNKQKFEVAYKFTEETGYSKIKDVNFTIGLFGRINPVAVIEPIVLKGNKIENISLGSFGRFNKLQLSKGDTVKVLYDIIPYCIFDETDEKCKRSHNNIIKSPSICPECLQPLELSDSNDILMCPNKKCPSRRKGKILNYLNKINIDGISYSTIDTFYNKGYIKNIKDIYKLKNYRSDLYDLNGFGQKSIDNIINEIENKKTVTFSQMLGSLGIENVSTKIFSKLFEYFTFDDIMDYSLNNTPDLLTVVPGIKIKTAQKIVDGIRENEKIILFLENELNLIQDKKQQCKFTVVFTKVRNEELEKWTEENFGKVKDTLTKDIDVLVVPMDGVKSSKVDKAKKYNIPIISIDKYKEYVQNNLI